MSSQKQASTEAILEELDVSEFLADAANAMSVVLAADESSWTGKAIEP